MNEEILKLKTDIYDIEAGFAQLQYMIEIIKDYGEYNSDHSDGVEKMTYLVNLLYQQHLTIREKLEEFIPGFQNQIKR